MDSTNPFDLFPVGPRPPAPDPPDNERDRQNSNEFFSAVSHPSSTTEDFQFSPSEASSYFQEFGSEVTIPGHHSTPSSSMQSQTTATAERDTSTISLWMEQMSNNVDQTNDKLDNLTSAITSLIVRVGQPMNEPTSEPSNQPRPNYDCLASHELPNQLLPLSQASTNEPITLYH